MDSQYQPMYRQAAALQHKFHDYSQAAAFDPHAAVLRNEIHGLTNDLATSKSPHLVEKRLRTIQNQLRQSQAMSPQTTPGQSPFLSNYQSRQLHNNFEKLRLNVRSHPNF